MGMTPLKAIREKCKECSCGQLAEIRDCFIPSCSLYLYRLGKNPYRKGIGGRLVTDRTKNLKSAEQNKIESAR